jgi:hypothetical protein
LSECQTAPQLTTCCGLRIPFSLTWQFSEEEGSLYPVQASFLYQTLHEKLNRALYIQSWLPSCYRPAQSAVHSKLVTVVLQASTSFVYICDHHSGCFPDDNSFARTLRSWVQVPYRYGYISRFCISMYSCVIGVLAKPWCSYNNSTKFLQYLKFKRYN